MPQRFPVPHIQEGGFKIMSNKIVYRQRSTAGQTIVWSLLIIIAFLLTGCGPKDPRSDDPCPSGGCEVPQAVPVVLCTSTDLGRGPCVGVMGEPARDGLWIYVPDGALFPAGHAVELCPTEDGGPVPCLWVPSVQGNGTGNAGSYLFGVPS